MVKQITLLIAIATCSVASKAVEPTEAQIYYSGRWDLANSSKPWCAWQGSSFTAAFNGRGITASIESDRVEYLRVIVDGDHLGSRKIKLEAGRRDYLLVSNLQLAQHTSKPSKRLTAVAADSICMASRLLMANWCQ